MSYRFQDMETAGNAYGRIRNAILGRESDASVYRVQIKGVPHVVALGDGDLPEDMRKKMEEACAAGEPVSIPSEISLILQERRSNRRLPGVFWEANYRPGRVVDTNKRRRRAN